MEVMTVKTLLINPPNNLFDAFELAPPIGLLSLGAALEQEDVEVEVLDFNLQGIADNSFVQENFYAKALKLIEEKSPDVVGFTSMVINSHIALELGKRIKAEQPETIIILGGTHFSSIAEEVLRFYPWVDYVIKGEGEIPFRNLIRLIKKGSRLNADDAPSNVAFRDGERIVASHVKKPFADMDELPFPDYRLVNVEDYFRLNPDRVFDYEPGRGCVYKCSFCYSPVHYGPGGQSKNIDRILSEMEELQNLGASHLFFVQDNFLNNAPLAKEICRAIAGANFKLTWNCYTTLPQMTEEMIRLLGQAGCVNAFTGIDAVNEDCQKEFLKKFYRGWGPLERTLKCCAEHNVVPTCAFMVENPTRGVDNLDKTLITALFAKCNGAGLRLNTLTLYNGTATDLALHDKALTYSELKPRLLLDCPDIVHVNEYARERPSLFPFHNTFLQEEVWHKFSVGMHITFTLFNAFPMTLYRYVTEDQGSIWRLVETLADKFYDLTEIHPDFRRSLERSQFIECFEQQSQLKAITKNSFELEAAELNVIYESEDRQLKVKTAVGDETRDVLLSGHELAAVSYDVSDLHRFDLAHTPEIKESRRLVLTINDRSIQYERVEEPVFSTLLNLKTNRSGFAEIDSSILETLKQVGLVSEATSVA
jgi:radical SAM superfamily enzyme YgiQ (UPF0313 family)